MTIVTTEKGCSRGRVNLSELFLQKGVGAATGIGVSMMTFGGVILLTGLRGAAATTRALSILGGPFGMFGGAVFLVFEGIAADWMGESCVMAIRERDGDEVDMMKVLA